MKLYVFNNELLGDDGTEFAAALCGEIEAETDADCFAKFEDEFGRNDFSASFSAP